MKFVFATTLFAIFGFVELIPKYALAGLEANPLVKEFDSLQMAPELSKDRLEYFVQAATDQIYGKGFVELGEASDFMHGHVIFEPRPGVDPKFIPRHKAWEITPPSTWNKMRAIAVLFHTQEFPKLRNEKPYVGPFGEIQYRNRNWLLLLKDFEFGKKGDIINAEKLVKDHFVHNKYWTINLSDIKTKAFGKKTYIKSQSFHFFRVHCSDAEAVATKNDNVIRVEVANPVGKKHVDNSCLTLLSRKCRDFPENHPEKCAGVSLEAYRY